MSDTGAHQTATRADGRALVDLGVQAADAYGRADLARRLRASRQRLDEPDLRVMVVGEFKQGKSTLINALLNAPVCPVDDDVATSVPTLVRYAESPRATVYPESDDTESDPPQPVTEEVPLERIADYVSEAGNPDNERGIALAEIGLPRQLLQSGISLVDTPGVGGLGSAHGRLTLGVLPTAEAVVLVSDASQEYSEPEISFLRHAVELCPNVACVITKIDLYPEWRKVERLDREHLAERAFGDLPLLPVSSTLREFAVRHEDRTINEESGFPAFIAFLREEIVARADALAARAAAADVVGVASQLRAQFASERDVLADPEAAQAHVERLEEAKARAEALRSRAARWQVTLGDGMADLSADLDHAFRAGTRDVIAEAEAMIDDQDPADTWEEFETWLEERTAQEVVEVYTLMHRRFAELAEEVADHFGDEGHAVVGDLSIDAPVDLMETAAAPGGVDTDKPGPLTQGMTAMRGSYGGFLMFSMMSRMVGLAAMNPAVGVIGFLMGRKAWRDERHRQVSQRRAQAKAAVRKYLDEVSFVVGKHLRDTIRHVQRDLRDRFQERAEEIQRSTSEALQGAQRAAQTGEAERQQRLADVEAELRRIDGLLERCRTIVPEVFRRPGLEGGEGRG